MTLLEFIQRLPQLLKAIPKTTEAWGGNDRQPLLIEVPQEGWLAHALAPSSDGQSAWDDDGGR